MPISLAINGVKFDVPSCVDPTTSLNEYLRCNNAFQGKVLQHAVCLSFREQGEVPALKQCCCWY